MTQAVLGYGTKVAFETTIGASPVAYTDIPEVLDVPDLPFTREFVDATNQDSNGSKEYIAGLKDTPEIEISANYLPNNATQALIKSMWDSGVARKWEIRETTASPVITYKGDAIVSSYTPSMPVQGKKLLKFKLRLTGTWTRT